VFAVAGPDFLSSEKNFTKKSLVRNRVVDAINAKSPALAMGLRKSIRESIDLGLQLKQDVKENIEREE
jgi:hypothetical protein